MREAYLIGAARSAVVARGGAFKHLLPHQLGAAVIQDLLQRSSIDLDQIDELVVSNAIGPGGNLARSVALASGLPERIAGLSIDRQCAGGLDAILIARALVASGQHDIVIAGGVESYSRRPLRAHQFTDGRDPEPYDQAPFTPWTDRDPDMAEAAQQLALDLDISKEAQDLWAIDSHQKACAAGTSLIDEITPIQAQKTDSFARALNMQHCIRAKAICGSITPANMAIAADGAAFVIVASKQVAQKLGVTGVQILSGATMGAEPTQPGLAPVPSIHAALGSASMKATDLTHIELMEAFAVQAIACQKACNLSVERINQKGGALARGHPIGASGAILAVRLFHDLSEKTGTGLATIASAGGVGTSLILRS